MKKSKAAKLKAKNVTINFAAGTKAKRGVKVKRNYRDSLFRYLFSNKRDLLDLYNALNGSNYKNPDDLEITTIKGLLYITMKNGISFIIASELCLYEHQSTFNPNMPVRGLFYLSQQFKMYIKRNGEDIYSSTQVMLPAPQYVIFYNGKHIEEDEKVLYLSDSFSRGRGSGCLECKCRYININRGHNKKIMDKCRLLWEYSEFVAKIDDNRRQGMELTKAIGTAIDDCVKENILKSFLIDQRAEVFEMILSLYNEYDAEEHFRRETKIARERGLKEGRAEERANTERERKRADEEKLRADRLACELEQLKILLENKR